MVIFLMPSIRFDLTFRLVKTATNTFLISLDSVDHTILIQLFISGHGKSLTLLHHTTL